MDSTDGDTPADWVGAADQAAVRRRLEAEEDERLAALDALRARSLTDVATALWARAMRVELGVGRGRIVGYIAAVGIDWFAVRTVAGEVDVPAEACRWIREVSEAPVQRPAGSPAAAARTFRARLAELELAGALVDVATVAGEPEVTGRIVAAADDHMVVRDLTGTTWYLAGLDWIRLPAG